MREYLGSRKSDSNINHGIKNTASNNPEDFFIFNNGITALVNGFSYSKELKKLKINGMSIVNGAQTTGAIGSLSLTPSEQLKIPIRFIKCDNPETVASVVKYNNSQNKINAPDFRSNDQYQKRITAEFVEMGQLDYSARRGGSVDVITRNPNLLPSVTAGQVLAAFHGEPSIAYNNKSKIWDSDRLYSMFFNEQTSAHHIYFCYSLVKAIEDLKLELISSNEELLTDQIKLLKFLRSRGSVILFTTALSDCMEKLLNRKVANKFAIRFSDNINFIDAKAIWRPIIDIASSFVDKLDEGLQDGIKNQERIDAARQTFISLIGAVRNANASVIDEFASKVTN